MPIAVEKIVDMLEKAIKDPADRWRALKELLKMNKNKPKAKDSNSTAPKRGRPRKTDAQPGWRESLRPARHDL